MNCYRCGAARSPDEAVCPRCGTPAGPGGYASGYPAPPPAYPPGYPLAPPPRRRNLTPIVVAVAAAVVIVAAFTAGLVLTRSSGSGAHGARPAPTLSSSSAAAREVQSSVPSVSPSLSGSSSPSAPPDFAAVYAAEQSGVVRIEVVGCSDSGIGTGFLLSPTLVATVDHVVTQALVVSLVVGDQRATGRVIGSDPGTDLALVQADRPLSGFVFSFAATPARVGDRVAAVGFPIGGPLSLTQGGVSGLGRVVPIDGTTRSGLIQTDAAINPGNSGGPLLGADGKVVGLVDAVDTAATGIGYAVPAAQAQPRLTSWTQSPQAPVHLQCTTPVGPDQPTDVVISGLTAEVSRGVTATFEQYFDGINTADYRSAWLALSPRLRGSSPTRFADGVSTSFDTDLEVLGAAQVDARTVHVALAFVSVQAPDKGTRPGETCTRWHLVYTLIEIGGAWFINGTAAYHGSKSDPC